MPGHTMIVVYRGVMLKIRCVSEVGSGISSGEYGVGRVKVERGWRCEGQVEVATEGRGRSRDFISGGRGKKERVGGELLNT